jgi:hypothetical protein
MSEDWIQRWKTRRLRMSQVMRDSKLSHEEKIEKLEQQKRALQRWVRFWPLRFLLDIQVLKEVSLVQQDIKMIDDKIEQVRRSKLRREKWVAANPNHPHLRHKRI